ncbi:type II toxin-antitoxin system VapC family toxin [Dyadobacter pollutisoli]|uniref:Type II toxin-antitoxin system VapC family toxin n=1 Tax=Dyadobacter pollutisoli TaxID=2910158 RepID=A0A9E8NHL7_9BACT|nr:type II toxin-antitoxin system VapC family toxin [Dyadobacter pollutisoli]WAC15141.1 type II toxin-antitoxin system VapC family toxin [Dyadobacter pollutisoli]
MKYLLDTHIIIWTFFETPKLSESIKSILSNKDNDIYVSSVNFWEISIKVNTGKIGLGKISPEELPGICLEAGFNLIDLNTTEASTYHQLAAQYHKDPFDRMLIWQAISNRYTLISDDDNIKNYTSEGLKVVW